MQSLCRPILKGRARSHARPATHRLAGLAGPLAAGGTRGHRTPLACQGIAFATHVPLPSHLLSAQQGMASEHASPAPTQLPHRW